VSSIITLVLLRETVCPYVRSVLLSGRPDASDTVREISLPFPWQLKYHSFPMKLFGTESV